MSDAAEKRFHFVAVETTPDRVDELSGLFFELGATGVEERDASTLAKPTDASSVVCVASFAEREAAEAALAELAGAWNATLEELVGDAWLDAWKEHFRPFALCEGIVVRPPWEPTPAWAGDAVVLELEPGRAFGTGLHATTALVARALVRARDRYAGRPLLDVGAGSGILSLVALALGASRALAIDVDPDGVDVTRENAARNAMSERVDASTTPVESVPGTFPFVVANIEARVLVPLAAPIRARVAQGGRLVVSGVLVGQRDEVVAAYEAVGLGVVDEEIEGEWTAIAFDAPRHD